MNVDIVLQLLLSLWLWALIWMERGIQANWRWKSKTIVSFWEVRTFALISFLWGLSAWISVVFQSQIFIVISIILLSLFILVYYGYSVFKEKQFWLTTEVAAIITFFSLSFCNDLICSNSNNTIYNSYFYSFFKTIYRKDYKKSKLRRIT